ncbi:MAG: hypothetical protein O2856_04050 [Planctomycetota bacterium]|nr:hypothetical protein [Planctomycetota bacterium]
MPRMKIAIILIVALAGCTVIEYEPRDGGKFRYSRALTNLRAGSMSVTKLPDGSLDVSVSDLSTEERLSVTIAELAKLKGVAP